MNNESEKQRVLFVSTGDASRGQMAEAILRHQAPSQYEVFSCGVSPAAEVHPLAVEVLREEGMEIQHEKPVSLAEVTLAYPDTPWAKLIILSETAYQSEEVLPAAVNRYYWIIEVPFLDEVPSSDSPQLQDRQRDQIRRVREELKTRICSWLEVDCCPDDRPIALQQDS